MPIAQHLEQSCQYLPTELKNSLVENLYQFEENLQRQGYTLPEQEAVIHSIARVWPASPFVRQSCLQNPALLLDLIDSGDLFDEYRREQYLSCLQQQVILSENELMSALRRFRRREMIRIAWRDLAGWALLSETLLDLSLLAESCIQFSLDFLYQQACQRFGTPCLTSGKAQQLIVLGMGKLGAWELNFSSDIDLIFAYAEDGVLADRKQTRYSEFFTRLGRRLIKVLDEVTAEGFVFRTDTRLRPFGESGPLVMNFDGMEAYYLTQAREWERYAMIKARPVAGDPESGARLMAMLKPFVYRRYLDYGAFEELRLLKLKINEELQRKDRLDNIKLGAGGIREIEFIGQAFQLIRGGQEPALQQRGIIPVLKILGKMRLLDETTAEQLINAYGFLRRLENHIQQYQDKQTHALPEEVQSQWLLAFSLGFDDWKSFKTELDQVRHFVHTAFEDVFALDSPQNINQESRLAWIGEAGEAVLTGYLIKLGYRQPDIILEDLQKFKQATAIKRLSRRGAAILDRLMPQILENLGQVSNPEQTLKRILGLFESVAGRNVYLSLLAENPQALRQLIRLVSASPWISDYLSRYPALFDELLDTRTLYEPLDRQDLAEQLARQLSKTDIDDEEQLMIALRKFKQTHVLRVAAADIMGVIPLMVVSDYLTCIAETILQQTLHHAWRLLAKKYGVPKDNPQPGAGFGILGFGKLGGLELGYGSDLDMVFLYDCSDGQALTDGNKAISCAQFYARLGQKIRHLLQTKMLCGQLYEVDMRLRPSGNAGLLVTHVCVYEDYLRNNAWTWEHQALLRARFITGDKNIETAFIPIRRNILCLPRDNGQLKREVREMREKMRSHLDVQNPDKFNLKQSKGGIADIEFIVQFKVLAHAWEKPELINHTDNIHLLDSLKSHGFISDTMAQTLKQAYCSYRDRVHRETLQGNPAIVAAGDYSEQRAQVEQIWREIMQ